MPYADPAAITVRSTTKTEFADRCPDHMTHDEYLSFLLKGADDPATDAEVLAQELAAELDGVGPDAEQVRRWVRQAIKAGE